MTRVEYSKENPAHSWFNCPFFLNRRQRTRRILRNMHSLAKRCSMISFHWLRQKNKHTKCTAT